MTTIDDTRAPRTSTRSHAGGAGALSAAELIALDERYSTHNYHPLPVVISSAQGAWVTDVDGKSYLDFLAGYSALNFGHSNPTLIEAAKAQLQSVTLTSRAFHHDQLGPFCAELAELTGT
ncbi:MAG: aminotransferase class III-fold pyridoxal phosphate-dependent enzyme, partial [Sciscionella sp.]